MKAYFEYEIKVIIYLLFIIIEKVIIIGDIYYLLNISVKILQFSEINSKY